MAVHLISSNPQALLTAFKNAIKKGEVQTWSENSQGYFTHNPVQWNNKAFLKPIIGSDRLVFGIIRPQNGSVPREIFGIYQGRIIESFIIHCSTLFTDGIATAFGTGDDLV